MAEASPFERRDDEAYRHALDGLPEMKHRPLVAAPDLQEVRKVLPVLGAIEFPVNSAGELIDTLGGATIRFDIEGMSVDPLRMVKYMPAYYFPIASMENLVEKLAELVRENRPTIDVAGELTQLKKQLPELSFPIDDREELRARIGRQVVRFQHARVSVDKALERVPDEVFPLRSQEHFDRVMGALMQTRPLIVAD